MILIRWTIMIPYIFTFSVLFTMVLVIPSLFLIFRWFSILATDKYFKIISMKVPTFYPGRQGRNEVVNIFFMSIVGVVYRGIHCAGWFFTFPSSDEAMLWRVSSAVFTCIAFLLPPLAYLFVKFSDSY